jgi:hypothetical protein
MNHVFDEKQGIICVKRTYIIHTEKAPCRTAVRFARREVAGHE